MLQPGGSETALVARLRSGDERAFGDLVDRLNCRLVAFAGTFTSSPALAEDIVQETWLAVIHGLRRFEGRSSLTTWIYGILIRRARSIAAREEHRSMLPLTDDRDEWQPGLGRHGLWDERPRSWGLQDPAQLFQTREVIELLRGALMALPESQRRVIILRDLEDVSAADACNILEITEANQRVLLHRARARMRRALDEYLKAAPVPERSAISQLAGPPIDPRGHRS
jgi:RNA polymerase sigma-70 factor (ECF subfamily)